MALSAHEKRVRRHVAGPTHEFFAACAPGLEDLCAIELSQLFPDGREISPMPGGVAFPGRLPDLYLANLSLTVANRVLMRIARFSAASFASLSAKAEAVPWELFLPPAGAPAVHVATQKCRLYHTEAVAERLASAIARRLGSRGESPGEGEAGQALYVRGRDDGFELSLDSSGELLHKRGLKGESANAPLRATLAAAVLAHAGYDPAKPLVDPMAGAGGFCLEACLRVKNMPAGWFRSFSFEGWPAFSPAAYAHLRKKLEEGFLRLENPRIFSSDRDENAVLGLSRLVEGAGLKDAVQVFGGDFFLLDPEDLCAGEKGLVVMNPPYGRRLSSPEDAEVFFFRLARRLGQAYGGFSIAVLCPRRAWLPMLTGLDFRRGPKVRRMAHGGLSIQLVTGVLA